mmetsp:Transcript_14417/g.40943  ORF Transcript_14417/g.40943 Transcript_14417/m.40943 type:complete len:323 (-) Transcript_14417:119-1087(-)
MDIALSDSAWEKNYRPVNQEMLDMGGEVEGGYNDVFEDDAASVYTKFGKFKPARGVRGVLYALFGLVFVVWATAGYGSVVAGWVDPLRASNWCAASVFVALWMPLIAFITNRGEKRSWVMTLEEFVCVWLLLSGCAQVFWELPYVIVKRQLFDLDYTTLSESQRWWWFFWMYPSGDTRYMRPDPATHATETFLAFSGFLELFAAYKLLRVDPHPRRRDLLYKACMIIAILTHWGFFWANTAVVYLSEIYAHFDHVENGWQGMWLKWGALNLQWSVLSPMCVGFALYLLVEKSREEGRQRHILEHGCLTIQNSDSDLTDDEDL